MPSPQRAKLELWARGRSVEFGFRSIVAAELRQMREGRYRRAMVRVWLVEVEVDERRSLAPEVWKRRDLAATQLYHDNTSLSHPQDHQRDQAGFCSDVPTNVRISE
jgi:hypothetical protein